MSNSPIVTATRVANFNSAHRLLNPHWDEQKNIEVFDKCYSPNYHGHNYKLVVHVTGAIDPDTGYVVDLKILKKLVNDLIIERFDHRNLNLDCDEFKNLNPTAENIAVVCWGLLRPHIDSAHHLKVVLHETDKNSVEYEGRVS